LHPTYKFKIRNSKFPSFYRNADNNTFAIIKYIANPVASTSVVINGADTNAGSILNRCAANGINDPIVFAQVHMAMIASATTNDS